MDFYIKEREDMKKRKIDKIFNLNILNDEYNERISPMV